MYGCYVMVIHIIISILVVRKKIGSNKNSNKIVNSLRSDNKKKKTSKFSYQHTLCLFYDVNSIA